MGSSLRNRLSTGQLATCASTLLPVLFSSKCTVFLDMPYMQGNEKCVRDAAMCVAVKSLSPTISGQALHPPPPPLPSRGRGSPTGGGGGTAGSSHLLHGPLNKNQHSGAATADHDKKSRQKKQAVVVGPSLPQPQTQPKQQQQQKQTRRPKAGLRPPPPPPPPGVLHHHPRPRPVICPSFYEGHLCEFSVM